MSEFDGIKVTVEAPDGTRTPVIGRVEEGGYCPHVRIRHVPLRNEDGSWSDSWRCEACGTEFRPVIRK